MKLSECKIGTIVCMRNDKTKEITHIGHIVDIDLQYEANLYRECNSYSRDSLVYKVRPFVKFAGEKFSRAVHPNNLEIFKD